MSKTRQTDSAARTYSLGTTRTGMPARPRRTTYVVLLTRLHAADGVRTTVYGPYRSFTRAEGDAKAWEAEGGRTCTVEPLTKPHD